MPIEQLGPVAQAATVIVVGVLVGALMTPLHAATARHRRVALLVDRVVTDRISRLEGAERRRAWRHLHRQAGVPGARALALAALATVVTAGAAVLTATTTDWSLDVARRAAVRTTIARIDAADLPSPTLAGAVQAAGVVLLAGCALAVAVLQVAVLLTADTAVAVALFLLGHQVVARARRPAACRVAPVVPEALRAARLPVTRERRMLRSRRSEPEVPSAPPGAVAAPVPPAGRPRTPPPGSVRRPVPPRPVTPSPSTRLIDLAAPEQPLHAHDPRQVGEYRLTGRLGSGGMGTVYLGHRAGTTGVVAVKVLAPHLLDDVDARTRFLREGRTLEQVTGDYTARVLGVGFDGSMPYIVMERLDGPSLHAFVCASGAVTDGEMLTRTAIALARALAALHADGITHRDLKPGNILLTSAGPKVVDFGIARVVGQTHHTPAGNMVGTPGYMAPEQVTGNGAVPASDVWAWACCVVFAARGDHLFDGENILDIARRILDGPGADDSAAVGRLSPRLVPVLRRATAQEAGDRPRDGAALLRLLDRSGATGTVGSAGWDRLIAAGAR